MNYGIRFLEFQRFLVVVGERYHLYRTAIRLPRGAQAWIRPASAKYLGRADLLALALAACIELHRAQGELETSPRLPQTATDAERAFAGAAYKAAVRTCRANMSDFRDDWMRADNKAR